MDRSVKFRFIGRAQGRVSIRDAPYVRFARQNAPGT